MGNCEFKLPYFQHILNISAELVEDALYTLLSLVQIQLVDT